MAMTEPAADFEAALARVIHDRRLAIGWTLEALAAAAGLHRTSVGLIERGERGLSVSAAHRIAAAFSLPLSALVAEAESAGE
jgi:transcriptional regulator with XRE-family HTH domain